MVVTARIRRGSPLQEMLSALPARKVSACSFATGISIWRLKRFACGGELEACEQEQVAKFLSRGSWAA
jgi:hypothetical protein